MTQKPNEPPEPITTDPTEIEGLISRVKDSNLPTRDVVLVERLLRLVLTFASIVEHKNVSIKRLKKLLFGPRSEKRSRAGSSSSQTSEPTPVAEADGTKVSDADVGEPSQSGARARRRGHGRIGADAFTSAKRVVCRDPVLEPSAACPATHCGGRLYDTRTPQIFIRLEGQPLVGATRFEQTVLRCSACQTRYAAPLPEGVPAEKWDATADVAIVMGRYGSGMPFHRIEQMQRDAGVPLPASTQYERCQAVDEATRPIVDALERAASSGDVVWVDDTPVRILEKTPDPKDPPPKGRTGRQTSGIVARVGPNQVALYYSGWRHAGENLERLLALRPQGLGVPIEMADALSCNWSGDFERIVSKCLTHARRPFVTLEGIFPAQSRRVLDDLATVYRIDDATRGMRDEERLAYHQEHSGPVLERLRVWIDEQMAGGHVEENGRLGKALVYMQTHWEGLTRFLEVAGTPLDNNIVERALRFAVLQRKASLFYKTWEGARVGGRMQSLIQTCRLNRVNAWEYLLDVVRHAREVSEEPDAWLPWVWAARVAVAGTRAA